MKPKRTILAALGPVLILLCGALSLGYAQSGLELDILPEVIVLNLPLTPGQRYEISYSLNPMKVIIDSALPILGITELGERDDVALKAVRYGEQAGGGARLVLDFNYQLPPPLWEEKDGFVEVRIHKKFADTRERLVTTGVLYGHQRRGDSFGPNIVNYLEIRTRFTGVEVKLGLAQDRVLGSECVSDIALRHKAIAAVNGAFFAGDGHPLGVFMIDGELISEPFAQRTALGLGPQVALMDGLGFKGEVHLPQGRQAAITGINRPRLEDDLIVYTPWYGEKTGTNGYGWEVTVVEGLVTNVQAGSSRIPPNGVVLSGHGLSKRILETIVNGDRVRIVTELEPDWGGLGVEQIIGGGPRLIRDGEVFLTGEKERFQKDVLVGRAPRTALGITADGKLLLVTVNGRQPNVSVGMSLEELAHLLLELGAVQAMNLDGGGSTTMVIRDLVLNLPSTGQERPVSNAIVITVPAGRL